MYARDNREICCGDHNNFLRKCLYPLVCLLCITSISDRHHHITYQILLNIYFNATFYNYYIQMWIIHKLNRDRHFYDLFNNFSHKILVLSWAFLSGLLFKVEINAFNVRAHKITQSQMTTEGIYTGRLLPSLLSFFWINEKRVISGWDKWPRG